jgi:hypothetical protein
MTSATDERLARLLGGAELSDLRARLRRRYYVAAAKSAPQLAIPLSGRPVIASWDAELTAAMIKTGIKIEEEAIAERIIDLLDKESRHT